MKIFKVYESTEAEHQLVLAKSPEQAADIAGTVWAEAGFLQAEMKVVELCLPNGDVGLIYEPNTTPIVFQNRTNRRS